MNELRERFPDLQPVNDAPSLFTVNGCGFGVYGKRDYDKETNSYIKTYCLCLIFIPILAISAYRVCDAPTGGWYFLGKVPVSGLANIWNKLLCFLIFILISGGIAAHQWDQYTTSPEYITAQKREKAQEQINQGKVFEAVKIYKSLLIAKQTPDKEEIKKLLKKVSEQILQKDGIQQQKQLFILLLNLKRRLPETDIIPHLPEKVLVFINTNSQSNYQEMLNLLDELTDYLPAPKVSKQRLALLESWTQNAPDNIHALTLLAKTYRNQKQFDKLKQLLIPRENELKDSEAAGMLGELYLKEQNYEKAYTILSPYVTKQLAILHQVEKDYQKVFTRAQDKAYKKLTNNPNSATYIHFSRMSEDERDIKLMEYLHKQIKSDSHVRKTLKKLQAASEVVPLALDLGFIKLNRARKIVDPAKRKQELEEVEKLFLSLSSVAGESSEYNLTLAQVYYWLGKEKEGQKLFDDILQKQKRSFQILMACAYKMRDIGEMDKARLLTEEAFSKAAKNEEKYDAALIRATIHKDLEDEIKWLDKVPGKTFELETRLNSAQGKKAEEEGQFEVAESYFKKAFRAYEKQAQTAATCNNQALSCFSLYSVTGDLKYQKEGISLMEKAISLNPNDTTLMSNTAHLLLAKSYLDMVSPEFNLQLLKLSGNRSLLSLLYQNQKDYKTVCSKLNSSPFYEKANNYLEKLLLLAPKGYSYYMTAQKNYTLTQDLAKLKNLYNLLTQAKPNLNGYYHDVIDMIKGKDVDKTKSNLKNSYKKILQQLKSIKKDDKNSMAYLLAHKASYDSSMPAYGIGKDNGSIVLEDAEKASKLRPCIYTTSILETALLYNTSLALAEKDKDYKFIFDHNRRFLDNTYMLALFMDLYPKKKKCVLENPFFIQAISLRKKYLTEFPDTQAPVDAVLFRDIDEAFANSILDNLMTNKLIEVNNKISDKLYFWHSEVMLDKYWLAKLNENQEKAEKLLIQARKGALLQVKDF